MSENSTSKEEKQVNLPVKPVPNETGGIQFSSHIKIFDPNTKEILVQKRGDN